MWNCNLIFCFAAAFRPSTQPRSTPKLPAQKTSIMKYSDEDFDSDIDL